METQSWEHPDPGPALLESDPGLGSLEETVSSLSGEESSSEAEDLRGPVLAFLVFNYPVNFGLGGVFLDSCFLLGESRKCLNSFILFKVFLIGVKYSNF